MQPVRQTIGGLGNLMFKQAYLWAQMRKGLIPDLYVQSDKYWKEYADEIKQMYSGRTGLIPYVGLQIRLGDYQKTNFYVDLLKTDYYQKAVQEFPNERFLVFCHDRQDPQQDLIDKMEARKFLDTFIAGRYEFWSADKDETVDMSVMSSCKGNIIANSTFGWWAAYLNPNNPKVICPKQWFTDGIQRCDLQDSWIKL